LGQRVKAGKFKDRNQLISEALTAYFIGIKSQSQTQKLRLPAYLLLSSFSLLFHCLEATDGKIGTRGNGQKNLKKKWKFFLLIELD